MFKIKNILYVISILCCSLSVYATSGFNHSPEKLKKIYYIKHDQQELNISDISYKMPLNFKVYKLSSGKTPYRPVNRYALKAGQSVFINTSYRNGFRYVDELLIVPPDKF